MRQIHRWITLPVAGMLQLHAAQAADAVSQNWTRSFPATCQALTTPSRDFTPACGTGPMQIKLNFVTPYQNAFLTLDTAVPGLPQLRMQIRDGRLFNAQSTVRLHVTAVNGRDMTGSCSLRKMPDSRLVLACVIGDIKAATYTIQAISQDTSPALAKSIFDDYSTAANALSSGSVSDSTH